MIQLQDFPGYYVTEEGRIYSDKSKKALKGSLTTPGYLQVKLYNNSRIEYRLIHRLVCAAYYSNPDNKREVNHLDGNKLNNHPKNLEWSTRSENHKHAYNIGMREHMRIAAAERLRKRMSKPIVAIDENGAMVNEYESIRAAAKSIKRSLSTLNDALKGKQKSCAGLKWAYKN